MLFCDFHHLFAGTYQIDSLRQGVECVAERYVHADGHTRYIVDVNKGVGLDVVCCNRFDCALAFGTMIHETEIVEEEILFAVGSYKRFGHADVQKAVGLDLNILSFPLF